MSTYKKIVLTDPAYKWLHLYLQGHKSESIGVKGFPHRDIGVNFQKVYGCRGLIIAQGPYIVHTILVPGPNLLTGVTYTKKGETIEAVPLRKDRLPELLPEMFTT